MNTRRSFVKKTAGTALLFGVGVGIANAYVPYDTHGCQNACSGSYSGSYMAGEGSERKEYCVYTCSEPGNPEKPCAYACR